MKQNITNLIPPSLKMYLIIGSTAFFIEYILFMGLIYASVQLIAAQMLSFSVGLVVSFIGNRKLTFGHNRDNYSLGGKQQFISYVILACVNLALSTLLLYFLAEILEVNALAVKVLVMAAVVCWNFLIFNKIIFRAKR